MRILRKWPRVIPSRSTCTALFETPIFYSSRPHQILNSYMHAGWEDNFSNKAEMFFSVLLTWISPPIFLSSSLSSSSSSEVAAALITVGFSHVRIVMKSAYKLRRGCPAPTGRISMKFDTGRPVWKSADTPNLVIIGQKCGGTLHEVPTTFILVGHINSPQKDFFLQHSIFVFYWEWLNNTRIMRCCVSTATDVTWRPQC